ncbi:MAG: spore coat associated protein CotJA [Clostridia bacterium]|nr:spore coat associated protein CotJA [Clostridia bacterium]
MPAQSMFPAKISLAMSYVPDQSFENLYDETTALSRGTLFRSLDFPFYGAKTREGMRK